jgi:hypothetical protein
MTAFPPTARKSAGNAASFVGDNELTCSNVAPPPKGGPQGRVSPVDRDGLRPIAPPLFFTTDSS